MCVCVAAALSVPKLCNCFQLGVNAYIRQHLHHLTVSKKYLHDGENH